MASWSHSNEQIGHSSVDQVDQCCAFASRASEVQASPGANYNQPEV